MRSDYSAPFRARYDAATTYVVQPWPRKKSRVVPSHQLECCCHRYRPVRVKRFPGTEKQLKSRGTVGGCLYFEDFLERGVDKVFDRPGSEKPVGESASVQADQEHCPARARASGSRISNLQLAYRLSKAQYPAVGLDKITPVNEGTPKRLDSRIDGMEWLLFLGKVWNGPCRGGLRTYACGCGPPIPGFGYFRTARLSGCPGSQASGTAHNPNIQGGSTVSKFSNRSPKTWRIYRPRNCRAHIILACASPAPCQRLSVAFWPCSLALGGTCSYERQSLLSPASPGPEWNV